METGRAVGDAPRSGFGVYVHWPFCAAKCPYCDFNSHVRRDGVDQAAFADALASELAAMRDLSGPREVTSIFFGGGTPSLMQPETVETVLTAIARLWTVSGDAEITLEANPNSVEAGRFADVAAAGVNRASIGVQALNDKDLKSLGRLHSAAEALRAVAHARAIFPQVSFDLIYARPRQSPDAWRAELSEALSLGPDHLSLYQLTIEPETAFFDLHRKGSLVLPDEDDAVAMFETSNTLCNEARLRAYEVSNHARPGSECRHNLVYWRAGDYAGAGPGAHARITNGHTRMALSCEKSPERWLARVGETGTGVTECEELTRAAQADEFLLMGLRLSEGISPRRYEDIAGRPLDAQTVSRLIGDGLLERCADSGALRTSQTGRLLLNTVIGQLSSASQDTPGSMGADQ